MITLRKYFLLSLLVISCSSSTISADENQYVRFAGWGALTGALTILTGRALERSHNVPNEYVAVAGLLAVGAQTYYMRNYSTEAKMKAKQISPLASVGCSLGGALVGGGTLAALVLRKVAEKN